MVGSLTLPQSAALLDILTHYDTYAEIRDFRHPGRLEDYGPPFVSQKSKPSSSPALQVLVSRFLVTLPGLRDLPEDFWKVQCFDIIDDLERANLSESYDKGAIGSRKTLATAVSALIEYPIRGTFGGFARVDEPKQSYDLDSADDLARSFRDFVNGAIYGTVLDDLVQRVTETDNLDEHEPLVRALHEFIIVNLASFMHYTLILSPKGQYLLKLIDNVNKLIPYIVIRQTLKIGNVASMIHAMIRVVLAKMSVASITNWIGLTQAKDEGMNLLQHIISTVLHWDIRDLESRASKVERDKKSFGKEQLHSLKDYATMSGEEQQRIRKQSQKDSVSIVTAVLRSAKLEMDLSEAQHKQALEYLSIHLSIRDRREIIRILCHSNPDHLTQGVREVVTAYEPVIRRMHEAIDLSGTVWDFECFLKDMIKLAKIQTAHKDSNEAIVPSVGDFAQLLRKHQKASHRFLHQCCKNGPELTSWYLDWAKKTASEFKQHDTMQYDDSSKSKGGGAGDLTGSLNELFASLPEEKQKKILPILDAQVSHLNSMHAASHSRLVSVLESRPSRAPSIAKIISSSASTSGGTAHSAPTSRNHSRTSTRPSSPIPPGRNSTDESTNSNQPSISATKSINAAAASSPLPDFKDPTSPVPVVSPTADPGPGAYLARWQDLLNNTAITPLTEKGKVQKASSPAVVNESAADVDGEKMVVFDEKVAKGEKISTAATTAIQQSRTDGPKKKKKNNNDDDEDDDNIDKESDDDEEAGVEANTSTTQKSHYQKAEDGYANKINISFVVECLGQPFRELLGKKGCNW